MSEVSKINSGGISQESGFFHCYSDYAKTLRTWLVAYGIGAPVLMAGSPSASSIFNHKTTACMVFGAFLLGAGIQVFVAFLFKICMWYMYCGELEQSFQSTYRYKVFGWIAGQLWFELLFDVASVALFGWATLKSLLLFL